MAIVTGTPSAAGLGETVDALREWQDDAAPFQLHPGDIGWFGRFGADATAAATRTWRRGGRIVAVGLLDGAELLRLTIAPDAVGDDELARHLVADVTDPQRGVLPAGRVAVETPSGLLVHDLLGEHGWPLDEPWTPLRHDLAEPVAESGLRLEVVGPEQASDWTAVLRSSFGTTSSEQRWHAMAGGVAYADARSLLAYDGSGVAVAVVTVWSAGPGRPGLLEPMGVHAEQRGRGYGRAICVAGAAELQRLGSSSATVCTRTANVGGVATYRAAGYRPQPLRRDRYRDS